MHLLRKLIVLILWVTYSLICWLLYFYLTINEKEESQICVNEMKGKWTHLEDNSTKICLHKVTVVSKEVNKLYIGGKKK